MKRVIAKLTFIKLLGAALGLAYSVSQAHLFGATAIMDAYFVAAAGVYMITSLAQGGQLAEVLIPEYLKVKHRGSPEAASALFSVVVTRMLSIVIAISALAILFAPFLIALLGPGLPEVNQATAVGMFRWSALIVVLTLFSSFVSTVLNAEGVFGRAEATGLISQIVSLSLLWAFYAQLGVWVLIYSQTFGALIELTSGIWFLRRKGIKFRISWSSPSYNLPNFFRVLYATSGYVASTQLLVTTMTACASLLPPGTLSVYSYIRLYCTKASTLLFSPLNTVLFSKLANQAARGTGKLTEALAVPVRVTALIAIAISAAAWMSGRPILKLVLNNPTFDGARLELAHSILFWGLVGIVISGVGSLFRRAAISLGEGKRLYFNWIVAQVLSCMATYVALRVFNEAGLIYVMPINMSLLAIASLKVSAGAGTDLRGALSAIAWDSNWIRLTTGVFFLPWLMNALPLELWMDEMPAALTRILLYFSPLFVLSTFLWLPRRADLIRGAT